MSDKLSFYMNHAHTRGLPVLIGPEPTGECGEYDRVYYRGNLIALYIPKTVPDERAVEIITEALDALPVSR